MELYPIYDENTKISPYIWYVLSGNGDIPTMRVGHTLVHILKSSTLNNEINNGKLFLIGGANPSDCFDDIYTLDLTSLTWSKLDKSKFLNTPRYEHSCFVDNSLNPTCIYVFGGSNPEANLNDICKFELNNDDNKWIEVKTFKNGTKPCCRTQHVGCIYKNQLVVFGGGKIASLPVADQQVHLYDPIANTWSTPNIKGQPPSNRHGHLMINFNDQCVYLHGGMNDKKFYNDLWMLDLNAYNWSRVKQHKSSLPCARAAHGGTCNTKCLFIFGGLDETANALGDFWSFNVEESSWSIVKITGDNPSSRLDFAYCKIKLTSKNHNENINSNGENDTTCVSNDNSQQAANIVSVLSVDEAGESNNVDSTKYVVNNATITLENNSEDQTISSNGCKTSKIVDEASCLNAIKNLCINETNNSNKIAETKEYFFIHGGMDCEGNVFDDCFLINLE